MSTSAGAAAGPEAGPEASPPAHGPTSGPTRSSAPPRGAIAAWVLFDWAAQPFFTLILTFLFAPYFASAVARTPVEGQALWGYAAAVAGVLVALSSPLLGAHAERGGRRKPWLAALSVLFVVAMTLLWLATPGAGTATLLVVLAAAVAATVAGELTIVVTNAMMTTLVGSRGLGRLSGVGWAVGYLGGLISLIVMAGLVIASPQSGKTLLGLEPMFALDSAAREGDRLVGPFSALWYAVFVVPFFLLVPDRPKPLTAAETRADRSSVWRELAATLRGLAGDRNTLRFLVARLLYADGLAAIFTFGGIYGASVFGWGATELGLLGITLTITGALGALAGGWLDDRIGAKPVIVGSLVLLVVAATGILSISREAILFSVPVAPKVAESGLYASAGEQAFLAFAILLGMVAGPVQASSRSLLARLAPPDRTAQYFGLYAFSGKVVAFAAPLLVALVTTASGDQRLGMAMIGLFLVAGLILLLPVREPRDGHSLARST
jgi:UMF1 family MFS transporter